MLGSEALCWASVKYGRISHFLFAYNVFLLFYIQSWWMPTQPSSPWRQDKHVPVCLFTFFVGSVAALSSPHSRVGCVGTVRVQLVSSVVLLADLRQVVHAQAAQLLCDGTLTLSDMCTHKINITLAVCGALQKSTWHNCHKMMTCQQGENTHSVRDFCSKKKINFNWS